MNVNGLIPAFPTWVITGGGGGGGGNGMTPGMSLRDYFAATALSGLLQEANAHFADDAIAELAYQLADAMMEARK